MSIQIKDLSFYYNRGLAFESAALDQINVELEEGKVYAIIGKTGSGKSTLVQHLNALLLPQTGSVTVNQHTVYSDRKNKNLKALRKEVGLVFQFSEYQLFEETILKDVAFGPKNFGATEKEAEEKAKQALQLVGIPEELYQRSPFELSGGQKRKVAIAGILALDPSVLVLDEPTAGLDPQSSIEMIALFQELNKVLKKTILLVTHDYEVAYRFADEVVLLKNGTLLMKKDSLAFFQDKQFLEEQQLEQPKLLSLKNALQQAGFKLSNDARDLDKIVQELKVQL